MSVNVDIETIRALAAEAFGEEIARDMTDEQLVDVFQRAARFDEPPAWLISRMEGDNE